MVIDDEFLKRLQHQAKKKHEDTSLKEFEKHNKDKVKILGFNNIVFKILNFKRLIPILSYNFSHYKHRHSTPYNYEDPENTSVNRYPNKIR